jgi:hypothetical protein
MAARWGARDVAWLVTFEGGSVAKNIPRWKRIGRAVFAETRHAPVILFPGETHWVLEEFRKEDWVNAFAFQSAADESALKRMFSGPLAAEWKKEPPRPIINVAPPLENAPAARDEKRITADEVRHAIWWSLLTTPTAGVSYGAEAVASWNTEMGVKEKDTPGSELPLWHRSLFLPGARQISHAATFFESIDFWRLRPQPRFVANQPGGIAPKRFIAAAGTDRNDISLVYVPEDRTLEILLEALPPSPSVTWLNPRNGENSPAVAVVGGRTCQFPTPDPGDWLLVMKTGK